MEETQSTHPDEALCLGKDSFSDWRAAADLKKQLDNIKSISIMKERKNASK